MEQPLFRPRRVTKDSRFQAQPTNRQLEAVYRRSRLRILSAMARSRFSCRPATPTPGAPVHRRRDHELWWESELEPDATFASLQWAIRTPTASCDDHSERRADTGAEGVDVCAHDAATVSSSEGPNLRSSSVSRRASPCSGSPTSTADDVDEILVASRPGGDLLALDRVRGRSTLSTSRSKSPRSRSQISMPTERRHRDRRRRRSRAAVDPAPRPDSDRRAIRGPDRRRRARITEITTRASTS